MLNILLILVYTGMLASNPGRISVAILYRGVRLQI
jgi:hypothetical protein